MVFAILVVLVLVVLTVRVTLVLTVAMLVITVFVYTMTVLVITMRMVMFISKIQLLMPERRHKCLTKSMSQQFTANEHTSRLFLRLVACNCPRTLDQVKLNPLITAG